MKKNLNLLINNNGNLSETFAKMQKKLKPNYSIEIGAHGAEFSNFMAKEYGIKSLAFEAGKDIYNLYKDTMHSLVSYINCAISDTDGAATFFVKDSSTAGYNGIKPDIGGYFAPHETVACHRLDTYLKDYDFDNACLWIDVEGASREVLMGATETLKKTSSIFMETEDRPYWQDQWLTSDVINYLESLGFTKVASEQVYKMQQNIIFIKKAVFKNLPGRS
jgi:FkbM family methyltransferase